MNKDTKKALANYITSNLYDLGALDSGNFGNRTEQLEFVSSEILKALGDYLVISGELLK